MSSYSLFLYCRRLPHPGGLPWRVGTYLKSEFYRSNDISATSPRLCQDLLQPLIVDLAELFDADLGIPDLGERRAAEAAENVADSPNGETDDQEAHDGGHHRLAEPIGRGFS